MVGGERLCRRDYLAANPFADVNMDGFVSPIDALVLVNDLNNNGVGDHSLIHNQPFTFLDVNRDGMRTPSDVLQVIGILNSDGAGEVEYGGHRNFTDPTEPFAWLDYNDDGRITDADTEAAVDYLMANGETDNDVFTTAPKWLDGNFNGRVTRTDAWGPEMWIREHGYTEYPLPEVDPIFLDATETPGPYSVIHVENANGIELAKANVNAYGGDINWTQVEYSTVEGSAANIERGYLRIGGTIVSETTARDGGYFTFDLGAGYGLGEEATVGMEFLADVASNLTGENPSIRVELSWLDGEVMEDGRPIDGWSIGHYDQPVVNLQPHGDLFVTESPVPARQMLLGTGAARGIGLNLRSDGGEPADVYELQFTSVTSTRSVDYFNVFTANSGEPTNHIGRANIGACDLNTVPLPSNTYCAHFQNEQLVILPGETYTVYAMPVLKSDVQDGMSGDTLIVGVGATGHGDVVIGQQSVKVRGRTSGNDYAYNVEGSTNGVVIGHDNFGRPNEPIISKPHELYGSQINQFDTVVHTDIAAMPTGWTDVLQLRIGTSNHDNSENGLNNRAVEGLIVPFTSYNERMSPRAYLYNAADAIVLAHASGIYDVNGVQMNEEFVTNGEYYAVFDGLRDNDVNTEIGPAEEIDLIMAMNFFGSDDPSVASMYQARFDHHDSKSLAGFAYGQNHLLTVDEDATTEIFSTWTDASAHNVLEGTLFQS